MNGRLFSEAWLKGFIFRHIPSNTNIISKITHHQLLLKNPQSFNFLEWRFLKTYIPLATIGIYERNKITNLFVLFSANSIDAYNNGHIGKTNIGKKPISTNVQSAFLILGDRTPDTLSWTYP